MPSGISVFIELPDGYGDEIRKHKVSYTELMELSKNKYIKQMGLSIQLYGQAMDHWEKMKNLLVSNLKMSDLMEAIKEVK